MLRRALPADVRLCEAASTPPGVDSTFKRPSDGGLGATVTDDPFEPRRRDLAGPKLSRRRQGLGPVGEIVYDFGGAELTSITAYRDNDCFRGTDVDYSNVSTSCLPCRRRDRLQPLQDLHPGAPPQGEAFGGKLDWLVGGYYANEGLRGRRQHSPTATTMALRQLLVAANFADR